MRPIVHLFAPIFFVAVGLSLNMREVDWASPFIWQFSLGMLVLAVGGKVLGALFLREDWITRWRIGVAMVPRGEVGLIFAELGRTASIFGNEIYAGMLLIVAFTTLMAPLGLKLLYRGEVAR
jgi:Kef-type K+ transport system membrane component KefB